MDELREAGYNEILLVDGHSVDRTVELASQRGIQMAAQEGVKKAEAFRIAIRCVDTQSFLIMDSQIFLRRIQISAIV